MTITNTGTATDTGEQVTKEQQEQHQKQEPANVPYSRFQEVIEARKAAETALEGIVAELVQDVPEAFRDLIPASLPAAERAAWIRAARTKGLFNPPAAIQNSPDSKRPSGKPDVNIETLSPLQKMQMGYGK